MGVAYMLLPNIDSSTLQPVADAVAKFPATKPMWGLHPCHVFADWQMELEKIKPWFTNIPAVAVGEIGLDFYWSKEFVNEQIQALTTQLEWALEFNLPVSLHTREATRETIDLVKPFISSGLRGVFHCFSGTLEEAIEITEMNFALGIGGSITYKNNPVRTFLHEIPLTCLVLETDSPYLPPVPYRGKRNESAYLVEIASAVAALYGISPDEVAETTTENAGRIFGLNS